MDSDIVLAQVVDEEPKPWGFWPTLGLSFAVMAACVGVQGVLTTIFIIAAQFGSHGRETDALMRQLGSNGLLLSLATWADLPCALGLTVLFVKLRPRWSSADYLALRSVPISTFAVWLAIVGLFVVVSETVTWFVGRTAVTDFMADIYRTAGFVPLLGATLVVAAPVGGEVFFRGFMFRGFQCSRLGAVGATVLTSLIWTIVHVQYDMFELVFVFGLGILFGIARAKSGSVYLTMAMHALVNLISLLETWFYFAA
jgi:uncharacterized protein